MFHHNGVHLTPPQCMGCYVVKATAMHVCMYECEHVVTAPAPSGAQQIPGKVLNRFHTSEGPGLHVAFSCT